MTISPQELNHLQELAALSLAPNESAHYQTDLDRIVKRVAQLQSVDTQGVPVYTHAHLTAPTALRPDQSQPCQTLTDQLAPMSQDHYVLVPKVID